MTNIYAFKNIIIVGTIYYHIFIYLTTWVSQYYTKQSQTDHICVSKILRRSIEDIRTKQGANLLPEYYLVVVELKMKLKWYWKFGQALGLKFSTPFS